MSKSPMSKSPMSRPQPVQQTAPSVFEITSLIRAVQKVVPQWFIGSGAIPKPDPEEEEMYDPANPGMKPKQ